MQDSTSPGQTPEQYPGQTPEPDSPNRKIRHKHGNRWAGLLLLGIGMVLIIRKVGVDIPDWIFSWPMILIVVGFFVGLLNNFRDFNWVILTGIGGFFLLDRLMPELNFGDFIFPGIFILIGLVVLFGRGRWHGHRRGRWRERHKKGAWGNSSDDPNYSYYDEPEEVTDKNSLLDSVAIFGGIKKTVYSKNFKGGEVVNIFGGAEINLSQADFTGTIEIEVVQIFGGTKLVVPAHWEVRTSESVAIFGGIDDKRSAQSITAIDKVLIIRGTTVFGGLEIRSF